jgi:pimeloyl-ACP methyl ester carboxylesterase
VIWGEQDRVLSPRWAEVYVSLLRRAILCTVPGAGHMPMLESPDAVAGLITDFLER